MQFVRRYGREGTVRDGKVPSKTYLTFSPTLGTVPFRPIPKDRQLSSWLTSHFVCRNTMWFHMMARLEFLQKQPLPINSQFYTFCFLKQLTSYITKADCLRCILQKSIYCTFRNRNSEGNLDILQIGRSQNFSSVVKFNFSTRKVHFIESTLSSPKRCMLKSLFMCGRVGGKYEMNARKVCHISLKR